MTHLGINSAVATTEKGFETVCFDTDKKLIDELTKNIVHISEPQLPELALKNKSLLNYTSDIGDLAACQIVYIAPDVPVTDDGISDLTELEAIFDLVISNVQKDTILVNLSQVPPGFTRARSNQGFSVFYQVETLIFGQAIERALNPERFIVGCSDPEMTLPNALLGYLESYGCPILPMRYESAELCKISINCFLASSISTANTLAELCENIGANWSEIVPALRLDRRIGPHSYLTPGLGIGGSNIVRDLTTVASLAEEHSCDYSLINACITNSSYRKDWAWRAINEQVLIQLKDPRIAILGLSYKENTNSTKNSPAIKLIEKLISFEVSVYDPWVETLFTPGTQLRTTSDPISCVENADVVLILTAWEEFKFLDIKKLASVMKGKWILDPLGMLSSSACEEEGLIYITLGVSDFN